MVPQLSLQNNSTRDEKCKNKFPTRRSLEWQQPINMEMTALWIRDFAKETEVATDNQAMMNE